MTNKQLKVTTLKELKTYKDGQVVELPPFAENQPLVARIRRPSILRLVEEGAIPNQLLGKANELYSNGTAGIMDTTDENMMKDSMELFRTIAKAMFVEPTYEQIIECTGGLTDEQFIFLFSYSQRGVKALENFRNK